VHAEGPVAFALGAHILVLVSMWSAPTVAIWHLAEVVAMSAVAVRRSLESMMDMVEKVVCG
jgi:hypothetical protein